MRFEEQNLPDQPQRVRAAFLRRNKKFNAIGEKNQSDLVIVPNCTKREQTCDLGRQLAFRLRGAPEISRRAHIDNQNHRKLAFLCKFFHICGAQTRRHIPINRSNFIAWLIFADILKIHSATFENTVVIAREGGLDQTARFDFECADFFQYVRGGLRATVIPSGTKRGRGIPLYSLQLHLTAHHGTGSPAKIRSMIVSLVTDSASAS